MIVRSAFERYPALAHIPFALVLLLVVVGMVRIGQYHWREGAALISLSLLAAGVMRAFLTAEQSGVIAIRGRTVDVLCYSAFGLLIMYVALTIAGGPFDA